MSLKAGRVGLATELVDEFGFLREDAPSGQYYTKTQADNKFETKTHVNNTFQKKTLEVPIEMLSGTKLTVEEALEGLNTEKQNTQLEVPIEMLSGTKLTVESALQGLNSEKMTYADNGILGAKNWFDKTDNTYTPDGVTVTQLDTGIEVVSNGSQTYGVKRIQCLNLKKNTEYIFSCIATLIESGWQNIKIEGKVGSGSYTTIAQISDTTNVETTFDVGNNDIIRFAFYAEKDTSVSGNGVKYENILLRLASDTDSTYQPYAMTNKELTDELTLKKSAVTNVITGATVVRNELYKYGRIVFLSLTATGVTANVDTKIADIPAGFEPLNVADILNNTDQHGAYTNNGGIFARDNFNNDTIRFEGFWMS